MTTTAVVGLGLIGGSLALALRRTRGDRIVAIDHRAVLDGAAARRASDERVAVDDRAAVDRALARADRVVLAAPVSVIVAELPRVIALAPVITDCGSTKRTIAARARSAPGGERFVPGHPMAGLAGGGLDRATPDLFEGRTWLLCPGDAAPHAIEDVEAVIAAVGARAVRLSAEEHDRAVALTSHVPQLVASALAVLGARREAGSATGPAFERFVRGAGGGDAMWSDIFSTNGDEIAHALRDLGRELAAAADGLAAEPPSVDAAAALLAEARKLR